MVVNLARGFRQRGLRVDVVLGRAEGPYLKDIPSGARMVDLGGRRMLSAILPLARYLRRERPDALISNLDYANVCVLLAGLVSGTKTRVAVVNHNQMSSQLRPMGWWKGNGMRLFCRYCYPWAHAVISVSVGAAADLAKVLNVPAGTVKVIYNPVVDETLFEEAQRSVSHPWLQTGEIPVVLAVGRLTRQKNFQLLIEAFALAKQQCPARLIILGEGELRQSLEQTIGELGLKGSVELPGFVANPRSFMSRAAVIAMSSDWEALPMTLIEALSLGKPIVATDCPSGPGEILAGGKYGRLVPAGNAGALAEAICDGLKGKIPSPLTESWQRYRVESITGEYVALFEEAAA